MEENKGLTDLAAILAEAVRTSSTPFTDDELRLLSRLLGRSSRGGNTSGDVILSAIIAGAVASTVLNRLHGSGGASSDKSAIPDIGGVIPPAGGFDEDPDGPTPVKPGPPDDPGGPQPVKPGPPDDPGGPQPIEPGGPDDPGGPQPTDPSSPSDPGETGVFDPNVFEQPVQLVWLEEFLVFAELERVMKFALENEKRFRMSSVVAPGASTGRVDFNYRRSRVLDDLGELGDMFRRRLERVLPRVLERLGLGVSRVSHIDVQMTATNDGEFFTVHADNSTKRFKSRKLSFVYFFHGEPPGFTGGELKLYNVRSFEEQSRRLERFTTVTPVQNQIFFFPSHLMHEITPVSVPSRRFADSRFTLNGWIHW